MVGNGEHIQFWKDIWLGDIPLMNAFPRIFQIASNPDSTFSQYREDNVWNLILRRNLNTGSWKRILASWPPFRLMQSTDKAGTSLSGDIAGMDPTQLKHATFNKAPRRP
ncbi:hypothetical protein H5410_011680 [Solanum commersonii]|uniref:Uncharacterized protein n=1 Tax=Solanum commersonii TaxID=4109 RepID=A0A9J6APD9_SOLCO|nr:hypothetical protein H5410_011680 [Solanum commersonii]